MIGVANVFAFFYASDLTYKIVLTLCIAADVIILATSTFWEKGLSTTATQEEYVRFDAVLTKAQIYAMVNLTDKEIEVADLLIEGLSLREIAVKLYISENTAKTHRSAVYKKMNVSSREELKEKLKYAA